ncbi:MAG: Holliday junction ATP-dependent DNA helicase RuvA [Gracilibacter sp. BRH_c7a]|nr:MAG: Holliday junction ATP-dependent DNA helicase RuvA [Gracilibacter sp. BRH_c7a]
MIGLLRGTVWVISTDKLVLDVNGIGYIVNTTVACTANVQVGDEISFHTHLIVREDDLILYGFSNVEDKDLFIQLLGVSGIGPKAALAILSTFSVRQIITAIVQENSSMLTEVSGIGGKTAKRVILELKEKVKDKAEMYAGIDNMDTKNDSTIISSGQGNEEFDYLLALGFSRQEVREALEKIDKNQVLNMEDRIREALRFMAMSKEKR